MFTGNRGCVVDDDERVVRHHGSTLWIICRTRYRGWRWPLARPRRWTPLFFLDDAVALAAGHRPCATCRRSDYDTYRDAVTRAVGAARPLLASELNRRLHHERLRPGRGLCRAEDRVLYPAPFPELPDGTVVVDTDGVCRLVLGPCLLRFTFDGWAMPRTRPRVGTATVLTPPTSRARPRSRVPRAAPLHRRDRGRPRHIDAELLIWRDQEAAYSLTTSTTQVMPNRSVSIP